MNNCKKIKTTSEFYQLQNLHSLIQLGSKALVILIYIIILVLKGPNTSYRKSFNQALKYQSLAWKYAWVHTAVTTKRFQT